MIFAIFDGRAAPPEHAPQPGQAETGLNSVVYVFRCVGVLFPFFSVGRGEERVYSPLSLREMGGVFMGTGEARPE
jgi:hypothetical protein